jgi:hypothetical protein
MPLATEGVRHRHDAVPSKGYVTHLILLDTIAYRQPGRAAALLPRYGM